MGGRGLPKHEQLLPPRGKAVSNQRIQEMMNHSHQILEIADLRNEASQNSSSLGFQDIWSPGSPPSLQLASAPSGLQPSSMALGHGSPGLLGHMLIPSQPVPLLPWLQTPTLLMSPTPHVLIQRTLSSS